ncbi:hypothetical protein Ddc_16437 [Ditylenchus destructor]|nr:hypothetical protein Ddc_16437 [Ditylenchus destructor]
MWHHQYIVLVLSISIITHLASLIIRGTNTIFGQTEHDVNDILILRVNNCEIGNYYYAYTYIMHRHILVAQLIVPELISGVTLSLNDNAFTTNNSNASCTPDHVALFLPPPYQSHLPAQLWLVKYDNRGVNYTVKEIPHQRIRLKHLIRIDNKTTKIMVDVDDYAQFFFDHIQQLAYIITKPESEVMPAICHVFTVRIWEPEMTSPKIRYHFNFVMDAQFKNAAFLSNPIKQLLFYIQPDSDRFFYMDYSSVLINLRNGIDSADDEHSVFNFSRAMKSDYFP